MVSDGRRRPPEAKATMVDRTEFHLSVINPNSDGDVTEYLYEVCAGVLPEGSHVVAVGCPRSPLVIETALDDIAAGPAIVRAALEAGSPDAFFVGCFGDPAVAALRELTDVPVVGLGEAALVQAALLTSRFGVVTTLERGIAALWSQVDAAGRGRGCVAIRSVEAVSDQERSDAGRTGPGAGGGNEGTSERESTLLSRLLAQGRALLDDGADGIVLACAAFGRHSDKMAAELGVPVCDGIAFGACLTYGLFKAGARTSKSGAYAWTRREI